MDGSHFDNITRSLATRRGVIGRLGLGGVAAMLLSVLGVRPSAAQEGAECEIAFEGLVSVGRSSDATSFAGEETDPGEITGTIAFSVAKSGVVENGTFLTESGVSFPVFGDVRGHAIALRIEISDRLVLVLNGVGHDLIRSCQGEVEGLMRGPLRGDLGDWSGTLSPPPDQETPTATATSAVLASATATSSPTPQGSSESCDSPLVECGGECVDLQSDPANCGACGAACDSGMCDDGICACVAGTVSCGQSCADLLTDPQNCGACGVACAAGDTCVDGICYLADAVCDGVACGSFNPERGYSHFCEGGICCRVHLACGGTCCLGGADPSPGNDATCTCGTCQPVGVPCGEGGVCPGCAGDDIYTTHVCVGTDQGDICCPQYRACGNVCCGPEQHCLADGATCDAAYPRSFDRR